MPGTPVAGQGSKYLPEFLVMLAGLAARLEQKHNKWIAGYIGLALAISLFYAPVWGELSLSTAAANHRLLFSTWRP
jgi:hypothetical protein